MSRLDRQRVLLVEDDERSAALVQLTLADHAMDVVWVASADEARAELRLGLPDALLLDLRLPDASGSAIAREVRAVPGGQDVVILAISASVLESHRREAIECGCDVFVEKPISPRELVSELQRRLRGRMRQAGHDG